MVYKFNVFSSAAVEPWFFDSTSFIILPSPLIIMTSPDNNAIITHYGELINHNQGLNHWTVA